MTDTDNDASSHKPSITYSSDYNSNSGTFSSSSSLQPLSPSPLLPSTSTPSLTLSHMLSNTTYSHNHARSLSQPAIPLSQDQPIAFLPNQQQFFDLMAEQHQEFSAHHQPPPPLQHTLDMSRFLDFAVEASMLLETLHQNGLIHGQLCPTSFRWEESSSLKKAIESNSTTTSPTSTTTISSSKTTTNTNASSSSTSGVPASSSNTSTSKTEQESYALLTSTLLGTNPASASTTSNSSNSASSPSSRTSYQSHPTRKDNHTSPASLSRTHTAGNTTSSTNNINSTNTNGLSSSQSSSSTGGTNNGKPGRRQRRYSLVLDCTHLGLGEKSSEPPDSPARKGLRDQSHHPLFRPPQSASSSPSTMALTNGSFESIHSGNSNSSSTTLGVSTSTAHPNAGSFLDPLLFSPSDANLQPYSTTNSAAAFHDAVTARMARIKRSLLPSSPSSPTLGQSSSHSSSTSSTVPSQSKSTSTDASGSPLPFVLKRHFMLHVPQVRVQAPVIFLFSSSTLPLCIFATPCYAMPCSLKKCTGACLCHISCKNRDPHQSRIHQAT
ncbi:MAG: hypothetical protein J3R72DRAFT_128175 [Linnemannia gamsii]|nr:MAG: hypothetical protein J3R72DRAFT_128175 [Linnemannia gamsii]